MSWSEPARTSAIVLMTGEERQDDSVTATLIRDIHAVFWSPQNDGRLKTTDLLAELHAIEESPWGDWYGKPLSAHGLSRLLKAYRIRTMPVKVGGETVRGYKVEQFEDAFAQLALRSVTGVTHESQSHAGSNAGNASNASPREIEENHGACSVHGATRHWRSKLGTVRCAECIPPVMEQAVAEWIEVA